MNNQSDNTLTNQPIVTIVAQQSSDGHYVLTDNRQTIDDRDRASDEDIEGLPHPQSMTTSTGDHYQHSHHSQLPTTSSTTIKPESGAMTDKNGEVNLPVGVGYQDQSTSWQPSGHHSPEQTTQTYPMTGATHQLYPTPVQTQQWHRNDRQNTYYNPHIQTQQPPIFIVVNHNQGTPMIRDQTADCKKITYTVLRIIQIILNIMSLLFWGFILLIIVIAVLFGTETEERKPSKENPSDLGISLLIVIIIGIISVNISAIIGAAAEVMCCQITHTIITIWFFPYCLIPITLTFLMANDWGRLTEPYPLIRNGSDVNDKNYN